MLVNTLKLIRKDGKIVDVTFYDISDIESVEILDIKKLRFEGMKAKDITKSHIQKEVFNGEEKIYIKNKKSGIVAGLSKKHLNKIISTVFTKDKEGKFGYLKKEIVSNVNSIFCAAVPILKHPELKKPLLFNTQLIHRFALPLKIGGLTFLVMITAKERTDYKDLLIDEFSIYDLYSEHQEIKKPLDSPSTASVDKSMTFRSHYQVDTYSINDLVQFVNLNVTKYQR